jgi:hypothetical protein
MYQPLALRRCFARWKATLARPFPAEDDLELQLPADQAISAPIAAIAVSAAALR